MDASDFMPGAEAVEQIRRDLAVYEPERIEARRQVAWRVPIFMGAFGLALPPLLSLAWPLFFDEDLYFIGLLLAAGAGYFGYWLYGYARKPATDTQQWLRDRLLPIAFGFIDEIRYRHRYVPDSFSRLPVETTGQIDEQEFDDVISGSYRGARFEIFEAHLQQKRGKSMHTLFRGVVLAFEIEPGFAGKLIATRRIGEISKWMRDFFGARELTEATSGDVHLDSDYEFRTDNPRAAKALLGSNFGKALTWVRQTWPGEPARIALSGGDGFLLLPDGKKNFFELPGISTPLVYEAHIEPIVADMASLLATAALVRQACLPETEQKTG